MHGHLHSRPIHPLAALLIGLVAVLGAAFLAACGESLPPADQSLIGRLTAERVAEGPKKIQLKDCGGKPQSVVPDQPQRACVGNSQRQVLITRRFLQWALDIEAPPGAVLEWSLAAFEGPKPKGRAIVELERDGETTTLWEQVVKAGGPWQRHSAVLPGGGRLKLRSGGAANMAWAEVHLRPAPSQQRSKTEQPDIVLTVLDTLRSDHLSVYGYERQTSPNLHRLAENAFVFTRSYSTSTWTLPSTASLLSGLLPSQHGVKKLGNVLPETVETAAERLRAAGYRTVALTDGGFASPRWGMAQGFERYDVTVGQPWKPKDAAKIVAEARAWLDENDFHPYFLLVHTYETHQPYTNEEGFADDYVDGAYEGRFETSATVPIMQPKSLSEADVDRLRDFYDGEIRRADHYVGQLLETLEASGHWPNTAFLLTSDHGEELREYGALEHAQGRVFDPNIRVPMIFKPSEGFVSSGKAGQRFDARVSGLDVAPTLLELAGLEIPQEFPGQSLLSHGLAGEVSTRERGVLVHGLNSIPELNEERFRFDLGPHGAVFDRVRGRLDVYELSDDGDHRRLPDEEAWATDVVNNLQAALAWLAPASFVVALPPDVEEVIISGDSKIDPLGVWDALAWKGLDADTDGARLSLTPSRPHHLVFGARPGSADWRLTLRRGEVLEEVVLQGRTADGKALQWRPLDGGAPPAMVLFPTAASHKARSTELTDNDRKELEALGYL